MATGRLGAADLSATTNTVLYTVPSSTKAALTVGLCNRSASAVTVRIALSASSTPTDAEWIIYGENLVANSALQCSGIILGAGQSLIVYSSAAQVSASVWGVEEAA